MLGFANETPKASKTKTIILSGKITDVKTNEYLAGVKIDFTNAKKTIYSDLDGNFFIYLEINTDEKSTIEFSQIGYSSKSLPIQELQSSSSNLTINLASE